MLLQQSTENLFKAVYRDRLQPNLANMPGDVLEGLQCICREKHFAFMVPMEEAAEHVPYLSCAVIYLPEELFKMAYAIVFNVHSPYIGIFRHMCVSQVTLHGNLDMNTCMVGTSSFTYVIEPTAEAG
jgi:hypothetical protein